jgi:hypothetical protein
MSNFKLNLNHPSEYKVAIVGPMKDAEYKQTVDMLDVKKDLALSKLQNTTRIEHVSDLT